LYGPTEAAIDVTHWTCRDEGLDSVPIGQPIANLGTYVLSNDLAPVPAGVVGELYLGGEGLARGYHRRPGLTAERFVASPFGEGERLYRTGDLARQRADGVIEYMGRIDHQVKIRGLRIELGEIEARLLEQDEVREAAVLAVQISGGLQLVAYLVPTDKTLVHAGADAQQALREHLKAQLKVHLPEFMVPHHMLLLDLLPLSPNGKLERKALPKPDASDAQRRYVAPRSELEAQIAQVWQDVLKLPQVGVTDNFFELGGDSIISIQVVSRARQLGIRFTPKELFQHQSVEALAGVARQGGEGLVIDQGPVTGAAQLLPFQQVFFETVSEQRHHWNQSVLLKAERRLESALLEQVLQALVAHHDALRLGFSEQAEGWQAQHRSIAEQRRQPLLQTAQATDGDALEVLAEQVQRSLDLAHGPLLKALLVDLDDGSQRLLLVIHHLVVDGVSWRVLFEDVQNAYQQLERGEPLALPAKTSAFKAWGEHLQAYAGEPARQQELAYWQASLSGAANTLPCERPQGSLQNRHAAAVRGNLDKGHTRQLLQDAPAAYRTQINDLLLTALARVIGRWAETEDVLIQLEGHGREDLFETLDLTRTVGWFTSLFPVRLSPGGQPGAAIKRIKEQLRAVPEKGIGFGVLRYLGDAQARQALQALPVPRITFNYLGQFDGSFDSASAALLSPAGESAGREQSPLAPLGNWLTLNSQVYGGELRVTWTYSQAMFDHATVQSLADDYMAELQVLIAHCCDTEVQGVTPSDFPLADVSQAWLDALALPARQIEHLYPLSPMQHGMLFHSLYERSSGQYINQMRLDVQGLDAERFRQAWQATVDAHDILRTAFLWQGDLAQPLQLVQRQLQVPFRVIDWQGREDHELALAQLADDEQQGFELDRAPLLRLVLVHLGEGRQHLLYTHHHILMDGWSNSQLMGEVLQRYHGQAVPQAGHYRDYIDWLQRQDGEANARFWKQQLANLEQPTRLASAIGQASAEQGQGDHYLTLDPSRLSAFAREQKVTVNTVLQAAWLLLLQRYTGQPNLCFGATVSGRPADLKGVEQQIGLFINTLPLISQVSPERLLGDWLQALQAQNLALREHEHTPLFEVQRWSGHGNDALFDTLLVFENYPISEALQEEERDELRFGALTTREQTNYPLTLSVGLGSNLALHFNYARAHFSDATIARIGRHLEQLLAQLPDAAGKALGELQMLADDEQQWLLHSCNALALDYPGEQCIHQQIEQQARRTPDQVALIAGTEQVSYAELDARANRLAHRLIELGVGPEVRVGVAMARSTELLVALLAVLKAGGAYVPLDPDYPSDRVAYMLQDSRALVLLTEAELLAGLPTDACEHVLLMTAHDPRLASYPSTCPGSDVSADNLAYVIYTSGSTGLPKGVAIAHRNVAALIAWTRQVYSQDDLQGVLASTSVCFDLSVWELFVSLACGGSIVLARNALHLPELPCRDQVRLVNTVPSAIAALQRAGQIPPSVRIVNLAGEPLKQSVVEALYQQPGIEHVYDLYGPSEDTTYSTWTRREAGGKANIGRPLHNTRGYLLDAQLQPVPEGVAAELYLAGAGITRGYLRRPGLTAERFVPNPNAAPGERMYRTGDLVRYQPGALLEYAGRIDHQVKIRGFRVELGEIEARLLALPGMREAAVVAVDGASGQQLAAYLVPGEVPADLDNWREQLRQALKVQLPEYMVPAYLILLPKLPLTPNGKLDRKALPAPDAAQMQKVYEAPGNALEQTLASIWEQVLGLPQVGVGDNFFELGGDSIVSIQVVRLAAQAGVVFTPKQLFEQQSVRNLAAAIAAAPDQAADAAGDLRQAQQTELAFWQRQCAGAATVLGQGVPSATVWQRRIALDIPALDLAAQAYRCVRGELLLAVLAQTLGGLLVRVTAASNRQLFIADGVADGASFPLRLDAETELAATLQQVKAQLRAVTHAGQGFAALQHSTDRSIREALAALAQPCVAFSAGQAASIAAFEGLAVHWAEEGKALHFVARHLPGDEAWFDALVAGYQHALAAFCEQSQASGCQPLVPIDFPLARLSQADLDRLPVAGQDIEDIYALSPMQEGMLFHSAGDNETGLYINQVSLPIDGVDPQRLLAAWHFVCERHDILRSSFHWQGDLAKPFQVVHRQVELAMAEHDWRGQADQAQRLQALAEHQLGLGFDLGQAPLQRLVLVRLDEQRYQLIWTSHHILMDGWSQSRLFGEVLQYYANGQVAGEVGRYRDFIAWLADQDQQALRGFWEQRLAQLDQPTSLSQAIHPRHSATAFGHRALYSNWDVQQTARMQAWCRNQRITLNTLVQGAWLLVLQRFTGQRTVTFGATVAGRPQNLAGADNMLGLFINTLPVIQTLEPSQPLEQWLLQLQDYNLDIRDHAHAPLADIQRWSGQGGQGLFDSIIVFENYPIDERLNEEADSGLSFGQSKNHGVTSFPMDLAVMVGERLSIEYMYMLEAFSEVAVEQIRHCMEVTLEAMLVGAGQALGSLQRLAEDERGALLDWGRTAASSAQPQLLPVLIQRQAQAQPHAIAVQCAGASLSYDELDARANRLAHALQAQGAGPEVVIGVAMPRSVDTVVAFLAVLKSGAAYVPLDIAYPPERLAYMMEDSAMALLIGHSTVNDRLPTPPGLASIALDHVDLSGYPASAPHSQADADTLAYLVYTSGSTGRPKGVAVPQGPLSGHCQAIAKLYEMDSSSCELHFMSFAFDGAHERWLTTLYSGGRLVLRDEELWTPEQTHRVLVEQAVTIACFPPAYLKQLADHVRERAVAPAPVRIYCFGGDAVPEQTFELVKQTLRPQYFTNGYGPTETVVTPVLWKTPASAQCEAAYAPIGRAVGERSLSVLDADLELLPRGLAGELYIGGQALARGYYRQPALTAERFVPDPHGAPGARVYRSGDLVRLRDSGVLDYVGRIDHQVKIRGFRIELGEIEASLRLQAGVRDALVVVRDGPSSKQLVGYVVSDDGRDCSERLRAGLRLSLPEHMVPVQVISLTSFPLTPNGKLDRKALPEPQFESDAYVAPTTDAEGWMAQIWAQVLQLEKVGITDNFFELGGDSILSLQVISRVRNHAELHMDLKLRDLMRYQTIKGLFEQKSAGSVRQGEDVTHQTSAGLFSLLPIQEWFFEQDMQEKHHYNQGLLLRARQPLDHDRLQQALGLMLQQHDALRLRFREENGRWYQQYAALETLDPADCLLHCAAADDQEVAEFADWAQRSLDLEKGPVMRVVHFVLANGESRLLLAIHHLVVDTVSWRILLQDLQQAYQALAVGSEVNLPLRSSSYSAWVERLRAHAPTLVQTELDWWLQQLDRPSVELPCDNPRGKDVVEHLVGLPVTLSESCTTQLLKRVPVVYQTQINDVLLAALSRVLCRWSEQQSVLIQFEGHGREDLFDEVELSRTVGWFTSMYPIRLEPGVEADFGHSIQAVKAQLAALPNKGLGYGVLRHLAEPAVCQRLQQLPPARVTFNYMGQFDQSFDDQALLVPAEQGAGQCYSRKAPLGNWLEIVGQVFDGQLTLRCLFSKRRYRPQTIEWLMAELQRELEALVAHCMEEALA
ncbi:amino acid adenylation domain-containing protein, partial [Pseudomonas sp. NPDC089752]|uniref:amino acid adenylation domain-containing protein n=1 Tax=Pseudomonas sp. NPDC089752 TaxID=3364472 RepID=UPI0037FADD03